ncbi:MAG: hypothetical protein ACLQNV_19355 [Steroidobacteraceae bacterium]
MLADLPRPCDVGVKRNAKGYRETWIGYKLHVDTADGDIPVSCVLTPHPELVEGGFRARQPGRHAAGDDDGRTLGQSLRSHGQRLRRGRDRGAQPRARPRADHRRQSAPRRRPQRGKGAGSKASGLVGHRPADDIRYNERSSAERVNANLKDNHGGRTVQAPGPAKVMCHLMFGILVVTVTQIIRLKRIAIDVGLDKDDLQPSTTSGGWRAIAHARSKTPPSAQIDPPRRRQNRHSSEINLTLRSCRDAIQHSQTFCKWLY